MGNGLQRSVYYCTGIIQSGLCYLIVQKFGLDKNAIYLLLGLTLTFVTLAIPIQFNGNYITLFWSAEAVLLFWLFQKSRIAAFKLGAIIVQILMLFSLMMDWEFYYTRSTGSTETSFQPDIHNRLHFSGISCTYLSSVEKRKRTC